MACCCAQILALSTVSLTKSCFRAIDCSIDDRGHSTLDAMPDVLCEGETFLWQKFTAFALLTMYTFVIPLGELTLLVVGRSSGRINDIDFQQTHGWYLQKYHAVRTHGRDASRERLLKRCRLLQGAWYAELIFVYYRIAMSAEAVLLSSPQNAAVCLALMCLTTSAMLVFVLVVKPFKDGTDLSEEATMTSADRKQAWALGATVAATLVGFACTQIQDREGSLDVVITAIITAIGTVPMLVGLYEMYKDRKAKQNDAGDADSNDDPVAPGESAQDARIRKDETENPMTTGLL